MKSMYSFRFESVIDQMLADISKDTEYTKTELIEMAVCNLYKMYYQTHPEIDYKDENFMQKLNFNRLYVEKKL